jgi:hypothetical protein
LARFLAIDGDLKGLLVQIRVMHAAARSAAASNTAGEIFIF